MFVNVIRQFCAALLFFAICQNCSTVFAETLSFPQVLGAALEHAYPLKIAREEIQVDRFRLEESQADYYPQLSLRFGNEYAHAFDKSAGVVSVGDTISTTDESTYKHSLVISLGYNLYDFGIRKLTVDNAGRQFRIANLEEKQTFWEVRRTVLEQYAAGLKLQKQIRTIEGVLELQQLSYRLLKQLREAGTVGQERIGDAALAVAESLSRLDELKIAFTEALSRLTIFTGEAYPPDQIQLRDLVVVAAQKNPGSVESLPEVAVFQQELEIKKAELAMVKRALLPKLSLYGSYRMFGNDPDSFSNSLADLSSRDASVVLYLEWPLFSGFESLAKMKRIQHEMNGLNYRKQQKIAELQQQQVQLVATSKTYLLSQDNRRGQEALITEGNLNAGRLAALQVSDRIAYHDKQIELARQQLAVELQRVDAAVAAVSLNFMAEAVL